MGMSDLSHGVVRALRPAGVANNDSYNSTPAPNMTSHTAANGSAHVTTTSDLRRRVTDDEIRLLALLADGLPVEAIARRLALSDRTVRRRSRALCDRLGARAPIQVVAWAARNGLI
ncbi:MAG TPA: LuxR C-terminal-related transcriptional regulator [Actinopolymorphaceae bacterium]